MLARFGQTGFEKVTNGERSSLRESAAVPTEMSIERSWYLQMVVMVFIEGCYDHVACDFGWRDGWMRARLAGRGCPALHYGVIRFALKA